MLDVLRAGPFDVAYLDRASGFGPLAGRMTGLITDPSQDAREGSLLRIHLRSGLQIVPRHGLEHLLDVNVERAGRLAEGSLVLHAEFFEPLYLAWVHLRPWLFAFTH